MTKVFEYQPGRRRTTGIVLGVIGIALNLLLYFIKATAGRCTGSIAVTADAYNNLLDMGKSGLALFGFWLSDRKRTRHFPHGFGRIEYLFGFIISGAILAIGGKVMISSIEKVIEPDPITPDILSAIMLTATIGIKMLMYLLNRHFGIKYDSTVMRATAADSLSDCFATVGILITMGIWVVCGLNIDGICGVMVAVCILWAGIISFKESLSPLLGCAPDEELTDDIREIITEYDSQISIEEISVHDYGPCAYTADIRLAGEDINIYSIKEQLKDKLGIQCVIEIEQHRSG